jgi:hypothetical protein
MGLLILESRFPGSGSDFDPIADRDPLPLAGSGFLDPFDPPRPHRCPYCGADLCNSTQNTTTTTDAGTLLSYGNQPPDQGARHSMYRP